MSLIITRGLGEGGGVSQFIRELEVVITSTSQLSLEVATADIEVIVEEE